MLGAVRWSERLAAARRSVNAWANGPARPSHTSDDLQWFPSYFERRAVVISAVACIAVVMGVARVSDLIWGPWEWIPAGLSAAAYWPIVWRFYLRHHYKPEFRDDVGADSEELPE